MQSLDGVHHHNPDSSSCCECHYVDVVSTNIQTASPGGQSLVVQSTPGPRHPQWDGIVSGAVDLGKTKITVGGNSTDTTNGAFCSTVIEPEDAGTSQGAKVTPRSPTR